MFEALETRSGNWENGFKPACRSKATPSPMAGL